jgi:hypothetical protein
VKVITYNQAHAVPICRLQWQAALQGSTQWELLQKVGYLHVCRLLHV